MATSEQTLGVRLELTQDEAQFLRSLLGQIGGSDSLIAKKHSTAIFRALATHTLPHTEPACVHENRVVYSPCYKNITYGEG